MRPPSSRWIWRKEIEWFSVALTSLIGMLTRPKEMAPFHMERTVDLPVRAAIHDIADITRWIARVLPYGAHHTSGGAAAHAQQPGQGAVSGIRIHQGRAAALLRDGRGG